MKEMRQLVPKAGTLFFAAEYPVSAHEIVKQFTDFEFLIGLIAKRDSVYKNLFLEDRDPKKYRIVDSGVFEDPNNPPTAEQLIRIAIDLDADEVVALDLLNDCEGTIREMSKFMEVLGDFPFKVQGVVQGRSLKEWLLCYEYMENHPRVDVIGVSYCEVPEDMKGMISEFGVPDEAEAARLALINLLAGGLGVDAPKFDGTSTEFRHRGPVKKPIHLLGLRHARAIPFYRTYPFIRSIDTSFPVQLGIEGRPLHFDSSKPVMKVNFKAKLIRAEKSLVAENTFRFLRLCHGREDSMIWDVVDRLAAIRLDQGEV